MCVSFNHQCYFSLFLYDSTISVQPLYAPGFYDDGLGISCLGSSFFLVNKQIVLIASEIVTNPARNTSPSSQRKTKQFHYSSLQQQAVVATESWKTMLSQNYSLYIKTTSKIEQS